MKLGKIIKKWRLVEDLTLRDVAKQMRIAPATLMRLEHGYDIDNHTFLRVLNWLMAMETAAPKKAA